MYMDNPLHCPLHVSLPPSFSLVIHAVWSEGLVKAHTKKTASPVVRLESAIHRLLLRAFTNWTTPGPPFTSWSGVLIRCRQAIGNLDETFWESSLEVTTNPAQDTMVAAVDLFQFSQSVPDIFEGILTKLTITGKSMEMLSGLGQLNKVLGKLLFRDDLRPQCRNGKQG